MICPHGALFMSLPPHKELKYRLPLDLSMCYRIAIGLSWDLMAMFRWAIKPLRVGRHIIGRRIDMKGEISSLYRGYYLQIEFNDNGAMTTGCELRNVAS